MPIEYEGDGAGPGTPIVKKQALGEHFIGAMCAEPERRQVHKPDGEPVFKKDGKPRYELVVSCITMPGTTAKAGIAGDEAVPDPGDVVRLIFRGGGYAEWIDALDKQRDALGVKGRFLGRAGDILEQTVEYGQAWSADGTKIGGELRTQAECDAVPRTQSLGYYGPLVMRSATPAEAEWDAKACELFRNADRPVVTAPEPAEPPF